MKFDSEYFDTVDDLVRAKNDAWVGRADRIERIDMVHKFTNMLNTMSDEEAEKLGRTEIVNHGLTYRDMLQSETQFTSMVTVTKSLLEVIVDTDNPEEDLVTGQRVSEAINRFAIHRKGKFANFWRKVAGQLVIAGGCPVTLPEKYGWLPKLRPDMFFPKETELDAEEVTFAFDPKEMGISDLKRLSASVKGDKAKYVDKANIDSLISAIEEQIENNTKISGSPYSQEISKSAHDSDKLTRTVTIPTWWYYEVKYTEDGEQFISATLFIDGINGIELKDKTQTSAKVVAYFEKAFENASDWLHMVCVDSEIGGVKNMDTLKGVAELVYPSGTEMEDLINLTIEGDKIRAKPKVRVLDTANPDNVAKWNIYEDLYAPAGVEEMEFKGNSAKLLTPFSMLSANAAGMSGGAVSNGSGGGGELRQQAVERQQNSAMLQTNRVAEAYNHLDSILETVTWRLLAGPVKPGTDGYRETMCVRNFLKKYKIDGKTLAEREYGQFKHIRVRARRSIGNGDRVQQLETADWLMSNIQNYEPIARPLVIHQATMLRTQDPDLTESLVKVPKSIINAQKITAENEFDTIKRRAALGQTLPVAQDDIHQDHIPVHLVDMQAHVASHSIRPWDKLDVIAFAGEVEHVGEHLKVLLSNPLTNPEAKVFIQDYQNITQSAQAIIAEVEKAQGNDQQQLTPKEQADLQIKAEGLRLEGIKLGIKTEDMNRLTESRLTKEALAKRSQFTKEINEDRRLKLDAERIKVQAASQKDKSNTKTK